MKQATAFFMVLALATSAVQAQDKKQQKAAAVTAAKATVAADKADLKRNWEAREYDKNQFDTYGLKADRKVHRKQEIKLLKDQLKKDVKVVKKAI
jgi:putative heme degradation protein